MFLALKMSDNLTLSFWETTNYYITVEPDVRCRDEFFFFDGKYFGMLHSTSIGQYVLISESRGTVVPRNLSFWSDKLEINKSGIPIYAPEYYCLSLTP